jgi:hypothetical protein
MVRVVPGVAVIVKALAPELNTMLFTVALEESVMEVLLEVSKLAVTVGTAFPDQFNTVFQSLENGFDSHVPEGGGGAPKPGAAEQSSSAAMDPSNGRRGRRSECFMDR